MSGITLRLPQVMMIQDKEECRLHSNDRRSRRLECRSEAEHAWFAWFRTVLQGENGANHIRARQLNLDYTSCLLHYNNMKTTTISVLEVLKTGAL